MYALGKTHQLTQGRVGRLKDIQQRLWCETRVSDAVQVKGATTRELVDKVGDGGIGTCWLCAHARKPVVERLDYRCVGACGGERDESLSVETAGSRGSNERCNGGLARRGKVEQGSPAKETFSWRQQKLYTRRTHSIETASGPAATAANWRKRERNMVLWMRKDVSQRWDGRWKEEKTGGQVVQLKSPAG